jgi:hypothetical protein
MAVSVLTRSYNNARTGVNQQETILNPTVVGTRGLAKLFSIPLGDLPGIEAQPLIVNNIGPFADGKNHDVVYACTMRNTILAFDAQDGRALWAAPLNLGNPVQNVPRGQKGSGNIDIKFINDNWGILSTPVIDPDTHSLYTISWSTTETTATQTSLAKSVHRLHEIDLITGVEKRAAIQIDGVVDSMSGIKFISPAQKQRSGLLLSTVKDGGGNSRKTIFMACGSVGETRANAHGWLIAFDVAIFKVAATFITTRKTHGGGIWQAAQGPAADGTGNIYFMTGNGGWDGTNDFGESFVKLKYTPAFNNTAASLNIVDWFTPFLDHSIRDANHLVVAQGRHMAATNQLRYDWTDQDLGSGGPILLSDLQLVVGCGKDGILFVLDQNKFGKTSTADLENPAQNYAKLKSPPIFFTFNGLGLNAAPGDARELNHYFLDNKTHHLHGSPLYWHSPDLGPLLYCWGENESLRAWSIDKNGTVQFLAKGDEVASLGTPGQDGHGGMPGGMITLSCNGNTPGTGIVWSLAPLNGDANSSVTQGAFRAYDATNFVTKPNGEKTLKLLWHSDQWNIIFNHNKFNVPVVANGRIYVPTYNGTIDVYGLTP